MNQTIVSYLSHFSWFSTFSNWSSNVLGFDSINLISFLIFLIAIIAIVKVLALVGGLGTYAERKISADIQMRYGPNRVGPYGLLQFLADGVKMFLKEDIIPAESDKLVFKLAPILALAGVFGTIAVIPFSSGLTLTDLNVGVIYLLGISGLVGIAIFLGGYSSNSKWSMLGGMRGAAQIISYEVPVTITILSIVLISGSLSFNSIIAAQDTGILGWYIFYNPFTFIAFFVFFISVMAETNRAPFDLPEAESELVSGYHTEYTGMRFGFFALAEYIEVFIVGAVTVTLFLGGYNLPFGLNDIAKFSETIGTSEIVSTIAIQILQVALFFAKTFVFYYVVIWIRWTLPRLRVDQLMTLCWKYLTPISLANLVGNAVWVYLFNGKSLFEIIFG